MFHSHLETMLVHVKIKPPGQLLFKSLKEHNSNPVAFVAANQREAVQRATNESVDEQPFQGADLLKKKKREMWWRKLCGFRGNFWEGRKRKNWKAG